MDISPWLGLALKLGLATVATIVAVIILLRIRK